MRNKNSHELVCECGGTRFKTQAKIVNASGFKIRKTACRACGIAGPEIRVIN